MTTKDLRVIVERWDKVLGGLHAQWAERWIDIDKPLPAVMLDEFAAAIGYETTYMDVEHVPIKPFQERVWKQQLGDTG